MKNTITRITTAGALLCAVTVGCAAEKKSDSPTMNGKVTFAPKAMQALTGSELSGVPVCGTFTLTPYQFTGDTNGDTEPAGSSVSFTTSGVSPTLLYPVGSTSNGTTGEVLGCASDGPNGVGAQSADNWGYTVTITNFTRCDGVATGDVALALAAASPIVQNYPIACSTSLDGTLPIEATIYLPTTLQSGYIDVSASISTQGVAVGCKIADVGSDGLHFGQTYTTAGSFATGSFAITGSSGFSYGAVINGNSETVPWVASDSQTASNLTTQINADSATDNVTATSAGNVVTLTSTLAGTLGNATTLASAAGGAVTVSGPTLTGGGVPPSSIDALTFLAGVSTVQQFSGVIADNQSPLMSDFYSTGIAPSGTSLIYQMIDPTARVSSACNGALINNYQGTSTLQFMGTGIAQCVTNMGSAAAAFPASPNTQTVDSTWYTTADLANAVIISSDYGTDSSLASATVRGTIGSQFIDVIYTSPQNLLAGLAAGATPAQYSGDSANTATSQWNAGALTEQAFPLPAGYIATGVYPNATGNWYASGAWTVGPSFWVTAYDNTGATGEPAADAHSQQPVFALLGVGETTISANWSAIPSAGGSACLGLFASGSTCAESPGLAALIATSLAAQCPGVPTTAFEY